ncbi:hypothetical protein LX69_02668 [Breznakibacter xylanolyticus]|uniref:Uncharacterized protein n=2 Tax=Breznakibacter xylanolyticus TaxID=990 RepID=A0A2W7NQ55_9BACT|nr:hypothetical protein LX69_02668 [Breznakibacter xylanolyticus]
MITMINTLGCTDHNTFKNDETLNEIFTPNEIHDISTLIDYTDDIVKSKTNQKDINHAYHVYFDILKDSMLANNYIIPISNKMKFNFLKSIDKNTIKEFWHIHHSKNINNEELILNRNGKFLNYIKEIGKSDSIFNDFYHFTIDMGDIYKAGLIIYFSNNDKINFNLAQNRILAMVCIFSISEEIKGQIIESITIPSNH